MCSSSAARARSPSTTSSSSATRCSCSESCASSSPTRAMVSALIADRSMPASCAASARSRATSWASRCASRCSACLRSFCDSSRIRTWISSSLAADWRSPIAPRRLRGGPSIWDSFCRREWTSRSLTSSSIGGEGGRGERCEARNRRSPAKPLRGGRTRGSARVDPLRSEAQGVHRTMSEGRESVKGRRDQRGQSLVLVVISMTVLLGMAALVLDLGLGWYAKRQLQASVDAAALAGAQELPSNANAVARAHEYIIKNPTRGVTDLQDTTTTKCLATAPGCAPVNALTVKATAKADTAFARIFGINSMTVGAKATACQPCGAKPLDIMIILDRTGSMSQGGTPNKIENAKSGIMTFLNFLDAGTAKVGLAVLPPATSVSARCTLPQTTNYDSTTAAYTVVPLSTDFKVNGVINPSSNLITTINCQQPNGSTHYSLAIQAAQ